MIGYDAFDCWLLGGRMAGAVVQEHVEVYLSIACQTGNMVPPLVYDCLKMGEPSRLGACCVQQKRLVLLETLHRLHRRHRPSQHRYQYYRSQPLFTWTSDCNLTLAWQSFYEFCPKNELRNNEDLLASYNFQGLICKSKAHVS